MTLKVFMVKTIPDFIQKLIEFTGDSKHIWYRGEESHNYNLMPSAYRDDDFVYSSQKKEESILAKAKSNLLHFDNTNKLTNDLSWLCYLQHNGAHTRLLDWTYDISTAFYFAFEKPINSKPISSGIMPSIWVLNLDRFLQNMLSYFSTNKNKIGFDSSPELISFFTEHHPKTVHEIVKIEQGQEKKQLNNSYIPFISPFVHERPKLQGSCFIRFPILGENNYSRDERVKIYNEFWLDNFISMNTSFNCLAHFLFQNPQRVTNELNIFNLDITRIYPEVSNIASRINYT